MSYIKNKVLKLYILVLVTLFSSCTYDYIEPPKSQDKVLRLSKGKVNIANNSIGVVDIISGVGGYRVSKSNDRADVHIIGKKVYIDALKIGETKIVVTDNVTKEERDIKVFIEEVDFEENILVDVTGGGSYTFGEKQITLSKGFKIGKYEVTVHQFCEYLNNNIDFKDGWNALLGDNWKIPNIEAIEKYGKYSYKPFKGKGNLPVTGMHWHYAKAYCKWKGGRLPTDTEWEYAAIGGEQGVGHGNALITDAEKEAMVFYFGNSPNKLENVQEKEPNILGIHNMIGNISEWVEDEWTDKVNGQYILLNGYGNGYGFVYNNDLITNFPLDGKAFKIPQSSILGHIHRGGSVYKGLNIGSTIHKSRSARWAAGVNGWWNDKEMGIRIVYDLP